MVSVKINLDRYSPGQIIELCEEGVITVQEIVDSGVQDRMFTDELSDFIREKKREEKTTVLTTGA